MSNLSFHSSFPIDSGDNAPTLVFLHYFGGAAVSWQWLIELLEDHYQCIAFDLPGFGNAAHFPEPTLKQYSSFIQKTLRQLKLDRIVLIGHSMGGKMALQVAVEDISAQVERVILIAPSPPTQEPMSQDEKERLLSDHHSLKVATTTINSATYQPLPEPRQAIAIQTHTQADDQTWRWWLLNGMTHSIAHQLDQIQIPINVIASLDDPVITWEVIQDEVLSCLPEAEVTQLSKVGHLIPLEAPGQLAQQILSLLKVETST